jgi:hypothetical protein
VLRIKIEIHQEHCKEASLLGCQPLAKLAYVRLTVTKHTRAATRWRIDALLSFRLSRPCCGSVQVGELSSAVSLGKESNER